MIRVCQDHISQFDWNSAVSEFADLSLLQTWEYGETASESRALETCRVLLLDDDRIVGAAQGLVRTLPYIGGGAVWINRGPLWKREGCSPSTLVAILRELREYWVSRRGMYLRVLPAVQPGEVQESLFREAGYESAGHSHPWMSARVDLSSSIHILRDSLRRNWNASLKKAESRGITINCGVGAALLDEVRREYEQLIDLKQFQSPVTSTFLETFQRLAEDRHKLLCFTASHQGKPLGGIALARYGSVCEYLVGAINEEGKSLNAGQLALWLAVVHAKESGYRWFDLGGLDPEETPRGVLYFKTGLGAEPYRLVGDFEAFTHGMINQAIRWKLERALRDMSTGEGRKREQ